MIRTATVIAVMLISGCECSEPEPRTDIPRYDAPRAGEPPELDGVLDEAFWQQAPQTEAFVRTMDGRAGEPTATARMAWDDDNLYIAFEIEDEYLKCDFDGLDAHLWEQDVAEVMIDPDSDGRNYVELQVSPTGLVFDTRFDLRRSPSPWGDFNWNSELRNGVAVRGTANDDEADQGYTVEMQIPHRGLVLARATEGPPQPGDTWRIALYALDALPEGQQGVGWSAPLVGDFHVPDRFGHVTFRE